jgi:hypothetical protein
MLSGRNKWWALPFILKLPDGILGRKVKVDLGGSQAVVTKEGHKGPGGDSLLNAIYAERVP